MDRLVRESRSRSRSRCWSPVLVLGPVLVLVRSLVLVPVPVLVPAPVLYRLRSWFRPASQPGRADAIAPTWLGRTTIKVFLRLCRCKINCCGRSQVAGDLPHLSPVLSQSV